MSTTFIKPTPTSGLNEVPHAELHSAEIDAINTIENKIDNTGVASPESKFLNANYKFVDIVVGSGGYAANVYATDDASTTVPTYKKLSYTPSATQVERTATVNNNEVLIATSLFDQAIDTTTLDAGVWTAIFQAKVSNSTGTTKLRLEVFARHTDNTETTLFSVSSNDIDNTTYSRVVLESAQPIYTVVATDKLGVRTYASTTRTTNTTVNYYVGDGEGWFIRTPIALRHSQLRDRDVSDCHPASAITNTPAGNISSTTTQAAINELDSEKLSKAVAGEINAITEKASLVDNDTFLIEDSADTYNKKKTLFSTIKNYVKTFLRDNLNIAPLYAPQGFLINGKIVRTVDGSGNMTVAIKTIAGNDPSASDPVYVRIGNTVRSITSALSATAYAGNNYLNLGSAELATKDCDLFVYLGWDSVANTVRIIFSRYPAARVLGNFVFDGTNEKGLWNTTAINNTATDEYELIGRFNATLSAGSAYTWSIPATDIIINRWENSSEFHTWNLTLTGGTTTPTFGNNNATYKIVGNRCIGSIALVNTSGGTAGSGAGDLILKLPFSAKNSNTNNDGIGYIYNGDLTSAINVGLTARNDIGTDIFVVGSCYQAVIPASYFTNAIRGINIKFDYEI